jgi:hypothetical protein
VKYASERTYNKKLTNISTLHPAMAAASASTVALTLAMVFSKKFFGLVGSVSDL